MRTVIVFAACFISNFVLAQPGSKGKPPKANPQTAAPKQQKLAANPYDLPVKTVLLPLAAIADGKAPLTNLTGTKPPKPWYSSFEYETALLFPGAAKHRLEQSTIKWESGKGKTRYTWNATLLSFIKGSQKEQLRQEFKQLCAAIVKLFPKAERKDYPTAENETSTFTMSNMEVRTYVSYDDKYSAESYLSITTTFDHLLKISSQQMLDSLNTDRDKQLALISNAKGKGEKIGNWASILSICGFTKEEVLREGKKLIQKLAAADMNTAFEMLMEWPESNDVKLLKESLSYDQQEVVKQKAQRVVEDYNNRNNQTPVTQPAEDWSVFKGAVTSSMITPANRHFYETVANDLKGVTKETFLKGGTSYYRFAQDYKISTNEYYYFKSSELKRNFVIVFYSEKSIASKSYVSVEYDGAASNNQRITGGNCTLQTDCGYNKICKTSCTGTIQVDKIGDNGFTYTFKLKYNPDLYGTKYLWTVLFDYK